MIHETSRMATTETPCSRAQLMKSISDQERSFSHASRMGSGLLEPAACCCAGAALPESDAVKSLFAAGRGGSAGTGITWPETETGTESQATTSSIQKLDQPV